MQYDVLERFKVASEFLIINFRPPSPYQNLVYVHEVYEFFKEKEENYEIFLKNCSRFGRFNHKSRNHMELLYHLIMDGKNNDLF